MRTHPLWRDADLPAKWGISMMWAHDADHVAAIYGDGDGYLAMEIYIVRNNGRWIPITPYTGVKFILIDGHPAVIAAGGSIVEVFDETTGIEYIVYAADPDYRGNAAANIAVARSLLNGADAP